MKDQSYHETLGGSWWCLVCHAPASIEDPGESNPVCGDCGKRRCEFRSQHAPSLIVLQAPAAELVPPEAQPMQNVRKLPRVDRPTLTQMACEGYWLCQACQQPTKKDDQDCCVLCGSSRVEFQKPTL